MNTGFFRHTQSASAVRGCWEPKIDTTISVHFPCGFHIEIGNAYLPRSETRDHATVHDSWHEVVPLHPILVRGAMGKMREAGPAQIEIFALDFPRHLSPLFAVHLMPVVLRWAPDCFLVFLRLLGFHPNPPR